MSNRGSYGANRRIRAADEAIRAAKAEYRPKISFLLPGELVWPTSILADSVRPASLLVRDSWNSMETSTGSPQERSVIASPGRPKPEDQLVDEHDRVTREVWTAYIAFFELLYENSNCRGSSRFREYFLLRVAGPYKYGVKNLIDVVTARSSSLRRGFPAFPPDHNSF